jgi:hypothetical protein
LVIPMNDLDRLRAKLDELEAMPLLDQAKALPALITQARSDLALYRGAVFDALAGPGRQMTIVDLARELGVSRGRVDDAIAAHRKARENS